MLHSSMFTKMFVFPIYPSNFPFSHEIIGIDVNLQTYIAR